MTDSSLRTSVDKNIIDKENVDIDKKKECLQTGIHGIMLRAPFLGTTLQCLDIYYSHFVPRAGVMFNSAAKKWEMLLNPHWFCNLITKQNREAILLHEIYHITHKHPMRAPFLKINEKRRHIMNVAMDMAINQYIPNLPDGCPSCPPIEEMMKGTKCTNELCPGGCIDVKHYHDIDKNGNKVPWKKLQPMEYYYQKLIEMIDGDSLTRDPTNISADLILKDNVDVIPQGSKNNKTLTATGNGPISALNSNLKKGSVVGLVAQDIAKNNGAYEVVNEGSDSTPFILKRHKNHDGGPGARVYVRDAIIDKAEKVSKAGKLKAWVVTGTQRAADSNLVDVDNADLIFEEMDVSASASPGDGNGLPNEFDSHHWDGNASENEMMDATEELVKRAMQKRSLSYDRLPGFIQELLQDIQTRRAELNYRQIILSAIKRNASGFNREYTWTRPSRRFGNKAPGTKNGRLPSLENYIDSSGSISIEEANSFLDIIDEFLKIGSRKCMLGLWHTNVYYHDKYKLGDRKHGNEWNKKFQSGGTDVGPTLKKIHEQQPDLAIILTDGYYDNVDVESWLRPGEHFPQVLWIISKEGTKDHPLKRFGETIQIPNSESSKLT